MPAVYKRTGLVVMSQLLIHIFFLHSGASHPTSKSTMPASASLKHRETNKYRFKTFSERLSQVKVNAPFKIQRRYGNSDENEHSSKVSESIDKWKDLDLSASFCKFRKDVQDKCKNYRMVVHYQDEIITSLKTHLKERDTLALQALLEILVSTCFDLDKAFQPHFPDFFSILTKMLNTQDVEKLEWIFTSISYLFYHQWRYLVTDIENVLVLYGSLLTGDHPAHISSFAAESISFLLRKVTDYNPVFSALCSLLQDKKESHEAIGHVLFEVVKSPQHRLHSSSANFVQEMLNYLSELHTAQSDQSNVIDRIVPTMDVFFKLTAEYAHCEHLKPVWDALMRFTMNQVDNGKLSNIVVVLFQYITTWCSVKRSSKVGNPGDVTKLIQLFSSKNWEGNCSDLIGRTALSISTLASVIVSGEHTTLSLEQRNLIFTLFLSNFNTKACFAFWRSVTSLLAQTTLESKEHEVFYKFLSTQSEKELSMVLELLCDFLFKRHEYPSHAEEASAYNNSVEIKPDVVTYLQCQSVFTSSSEGDHLQLKWHCLVVMLHLAKLRSDEQSQQMIYEWVLTCLEGTPEIVVTNELLGVLAVAIHYISMTDRVENERFTEFESWFKSWSNNKHFLFIVHFLLVRNPAFKTAFLNSNPSSLLEKNVSSEHLSVRSLSLRILGLIDADHSDFYHSCIAADLIPATIHDYRERVMQFSKLQKDVDDSPTDSKKRILLHLLISSMYINFSPLWKPMQDLICSNVPNQRNHSFWSILFETFRNACKNAEQSGWWIRNKADSGNSSSGHYQEYIDNVRKSNYTENLVSNHFNFRLQVLKLFNLLSHNHVFSNHHETLATSLFSYIDEELCHVDNRFGLKGDLKNMGENNDERVYRKKDGILTLLEYFRVLSKYNPFQASSHLSRLKSIFHKALSHLNTDLQKVSLDCLLKLYKNASKYKDTLVEFFNDKDFRDILTKLDLEDYLPIEREEFMPLLIRILLGRMSCKTGGATGGKHQSSTRCSIITRFVSNLETNEISCYLSLVLEPYADILSNDVLLNDCLQGNVDINVPYSVQQGFLSKINIIIDVLKDKMPRDLFFNILSVLVYMNHSNLQNLGQDNEKHVSSILRNLKKLIMGSMVILMEAWPKDEVLMEKEIKSICQGFIQTNMANLMDECCGSPTAFLKLLHVFSKREAYIPILFKKIEENCYNSLTLLSKSAATCHSPMDLLVSLLHSSKTSKSITSYILEMLSGLVLPAEYDPSDEEMEISSVKIQHNDQLSPYGTLTTELDTASLTADKRLGYVLLKPWAHDLVVFFQNRLSKLNAGSDLFVDRELRLLSTLTSDLTDKAVNLGFTELLLHHISTISSCKNPDSDVLLSALETLSNVISDSRNTRKLGDLFLRISDRKVRLKLVDVLQKSCSDDSDMQWTCRMVANLNAWDKRFVEELDFERRLTAFQEIVDKLNGDDYEELFQNDCISLYPILTCCVHTLLNLYSDISIRESVSRLLEKVASRVNDLLLLNMDFGVVVYKHIVKNVLLPAIQHGLQSPNEGCRHESIRLLSTTLRYFPNEKTLVGLSQLINDSSPDEDIFLNMQHIQMHRRSRALQRLSEIICPKQLKLSERSAPDSSSAENESDTRVSIPHTTAVKYLLPIAMKTLEFNNLKETRHLYDACLAVVKSCVAIMPWSSYKQFLLRYIFMVKKSKVYVDVVIAVIDAFPFNVRNVKIKLSDDKFVPKRKKKAMEETGASAGPNIDDDAMETDQNDPCDVQSEKIVNGLIQVILPKLDMFLSSNDNKDHHHKLSKAEMNSSTYKNKVALIIAFISLLTKMPKNILNAWLPGVIHKVTDFLSHQKFEIRQLGVYAFPQIMKMLGPKYLYVVVSELKSRLTRGFQKHVLTKTVNTLLTSQIPVLKPGDLDNCVASIVGILNEDLFGFTATEKNVKQLQVKIPEARGRSKAFTAYKTLSTFIGKNQIIPMLNPIMEKIEFCTRATVKKSIAEVLLEISNGLVENQSLVAEDVLTLVDGLIDTSAIQHFRKNNNYLPVKHDPRLQPESSLLLQRSAGREVNRKTSFSRKSNDHLLIEFSLFYMHSCLKQQTISLKEHDHLELLDPLIPKLQQCLHSPNTRTVMLSIRCLSKVFPLSLPSLKDQVDDIFKTLVNILEENSKSAGDHETVSVSFKALSLLCSSGYGEQLKTEQLLLLLNYIEVDLYNDERQSQAFSLLRCIVKRDFQSKELNEVILKVRKIAIQSHNQASRNQANSLYLLFLVSNPFSNKELENHVEFILSQLMYEYEDGRLSALELLYAIIEKFPESLVNKFATLMFIPNAAVLINDDSSKCKKAASVLINLLLKRTNDDIRNQLFNIVSQW